MKYAPPPRYCLYLQIQIPEGYTNWEKEVATDVIVHDFLNSPKDAKWELADVTNWIEDVLRDNEMEKRQ